MRGVSAVIIAQDEAERLESCVDSCRAFADEIVVVDGGSEDGTPELARSLGCVVYENPWPGYGRQRNFGAERAAHDWIFWIDADEVVGADLATSISDWKGGSPDAGHAFAVERVGDFMGRWLFGAAEWLVRLYDRTSCRISEVPVHEEVEGGGEPARLSGRLWHHGFRSISDHVVRFDRYTGLEAEKAWQRGRRFSLWRMLWRPPARLLQRFFLQRMYREGVAGLAVCALWAEYEVMRELKLRELAWIDQGRPRDRRDETG
jgi:glycosyltransferase involved in cell wall biosynthesis